MSLANFWITIYAFMAHQQHFRSERKGKERKAERKEMNNVVKKSIRQEIEYCYKEKGEGSKSEDTLPKNTTNIQQIFEASSSFHVK